MTGAPDWVKGKAMEEASARAQRAYALASAKGYVRSLDREGFAAFKAWLAELEAERPELRNLPRHRSMDP